MSHFKLLLSLIVVLSASTSLAQKADAPKGKQVLATVEGLPIYEDDLDQAIQGQLMPLRTQEYEIKKKALDGLIEQKILEAAAKKKGLTTEKLLELEVASKIPDPSDAVVEGYYLALKDRIRSPFAEIKNALRESVKQAQVSQARQEFIKRLRGESDVAIMMPAPRVDVQYDAARMRGNPKALITIVEFSDYQCPYCHSAEPIVKRVLAKYGDKVSLSYRDFPLSGIHPLAQMAAVASRCALEQGKFWEYHDQLFSTTNLEKNSLLEYARNLKLDDKQFEACLSSGKYNIAIDRDAQEGRKVGVTGTPAFFINGISLSGAQPEDSFVKVIEDELARKN